MILENFTSTLINVGVNPRNGKSRLISMEISLSIINPPVLMGYGISKNHHVTFKITFKINFHFIPPNSRDFFLNELQFDIYKY